MNKYKQHELHPEWSETHPKEHHHYESTEAEIVDNLRKQSETMKSDIAAFKRLAQCFYNFKKIKDSEKKMDEKRQEKMIPGTLYNLIKYEGKNMLIQLESGNFDNEMFMKKEKEEENGPFSNSPLPLFVVGIAADETKKISSPTTFLNNNAVIISHKPWKIMPPPWGGEHQAKEIDYNPITIYHYNEAFNNLQKALFIRMFDSGEKIIKKRMEEISKLQKISEKEFLILRRRKDEYYTDAEKAIFQMLEDMSDEESDMYTNLQTFVIPQNS
ncbi:MAG: hypothetical protein ACD_80C00113G0022 [uncultured bacterium (gcode 4)]|uniref:Uncharacterized protein n=1 Tax=uncultured bacterium (gcode 4) TaxID=1234023 RepID=K1YIJ2_9BACT|nr:MAG: hypothetical protein ACD_80C00113G0022 [uncultured bacterium (gcode 4)]